MKRCPHCEFIYNDDQSLCDMDGQTLVIDNSFALTPTGTGVAAIDSRPNALIIPTISGLALAAVLFFGYFASPLLLSRSASDASVPVQVLPPPEPPPAVSDSLAVSDESLDRASDSNTAATESNSIREATTADKRLSIPRGVRALPTLKPLPRLPGAQVTPPRNPAPAQKKDSKVESFLKKTGKVLKRPFKF